MGIELNIIIGTYKNTQRKFSHTSSSFIYKLLLEKFTCTFKQILQRYVIILPKIQHKNSVKLCNKLKTLSKPNNHFLCILYRDKYILKHPKHGKQISRRKINTFYKFIIIINIVILNIMTCLIFWKEKNELLLKIWLWK